MKVYLLWQSENVDEMLGVFASVEAAKASRPDLDWRTKDGVRWTAKHFYWIQECEVQGVAN